ncbi:ribosome maturation factor RimM [Acetohalobium arabaticum]|uniref:Ribosome maturation factor RimM n=1 Tax=Acetohalobium arabaticum (strain ATCC 49924 / DSM 5501 / Z-7288) TaxID=574087 RepID=D9QRN0_ACEAZ|nr:ribosome maturation factor RimM [Acetohalobium arabaticum]ADL13171.1 16S rRNA processing protein RimM [Acetohalobium arabaticum DSM 5501]
MDEELIDIGKITRHQGNKGEVRVLPLTDYPERFEFLERAILVKDNKKEEVIVEDMRYHKQFIVLKFAEFDDIGTAIEHKDFMVKIPESEAIELPEGHYYLHEIIDLKVVTVDGQNLGKVTDILETGSNDVYVVQSGSKEHLIPGTKEVIKQIDLEAKEMVIKPIKGLI